MTTPEVRLTSGGVPRVVCDGLSDPQCVKNFWAKVNPPNENGCRTWSAHHNAQGRGTFHGGPFRHSGERASLLSHAFRWEMDNGPIPSGLLVRHRCDVGDCNEITHLHLGTDADNSRDRSERCINANGGEGNGNATLTRQEAREIYDLAWCGLFSQRQIGDWYNILGKYVNPIKTGRARAFDTGHVNAPGSTGAKMTPAEAAQVYDLATKGAPLTHKEIGFAYGVTKHAVARVKAGQTWRDVSGYLKDVA